MAVTKGEFEAALTAYYSTEAYGLLEALASHIDEQRVALEGGIEQADEHSIEYGRMLGAAAAMRTFAWLLRSPEITPVLKLGRDDDATPLEADEMLTRLRLAAPLVLKTA